jgi:hypothetical protein
LKKKTVYWYTISRLSKQSYKVEYIRSIKLATQAWQRRGITTAAPFKVSGFATQTKNKQNTATSKLTKTTQTEMHIIITKAALSEVLQST